ncbi:MAG: hypothetical protein LBM96_04510, partial [Methanobrevibacter sp.]|nr:hypothetical protein [Candidatus Methanoflexus mossambicus]
GFFISIRKIPLLFHVINFLECFLLDLSPTELLATYFAKSFRKITNFIKSVHLNIITGASVFVLDILKYMLH